MTARDHLLARLAGYYPSAWPAECGGPRRQKVTRAPGLAIGANEKLVAQTRELDGNRWPVMFVQRAPGELYLQGGSRFGETKDSHGWVEQLEPHTLEPIRRSPKLPSGGHNWCGALSVHENGDLYVVNGTYCHRLSPELHVVAEHRLTTNNAHNGHVVLSDGNLVMKDISDDPARRAVFTVLDPYLTVIDRYEFPWNSVGRFSSDRVGDRDYLYVTSPTEIRRLVYAWGRLTLDESWSAPYAVAGEDQGFAWDSTIGDDCVWFMDMGESRDTRAMLGSQPIGTRTPSGFGPALHESPVRVFRISTIDSEDRDAFVPFGEPAGHIIAPPLYDQDRRILVAFDSNNGKIGAWRYEGPGRFTRLWQHDWRSTNQLMLYADTGELIVDHLPTPGVWHAVVVDIETGAERGRADTGCLRSGGMWYTPGFERDFYTSTPLGCIARISVA